MDLAAGVQEAALNAARELWEECHGIGKDTSGIEFSNTRTLNLVHLRVSFVALGRWFMSLAFVLYYDWFSGLGFKSIQKAVYRFWWILDGDQSRSKWKPEGRKKT